MDGSVLLLLILESAALLLGVLLVARNVADALRGN